MTKHEYKCPECDEPAEMARPHNAKGGWALDVEEHRLRHRHVQGKTALCPVMTSQGYQPAKAVRA